jgi:SAM-dependent methyltransferase
MTDAAVPDYDEAMRAFHRAFEPELKGLVAGLNLPLAGRVLDVPCGDGFYSLELARQVFPFGSVVAGDACDGYLERARERFRRREEGGIIAAEKVDVYRMPFSDARFDVVWCAQSLISLAEPERALEEMYRVTKPGGVVAILENDQYHHALLNWPVELEMAVQRASAEASRHRYGASGKLAPARDVSRMLIATGWALEGGHTLAADRRAPFDAATRGFLEAHLRELFEFVRDYLTDDERHLFETWTDPDNAESILNSPTAQLSCLNTLFVGRRAERTTETQRHREEKAEKNSEQSE